MKKKLSFLLCLVLTLAMTFAMVGCGETEKSEVSTTTKKETTVSGEKEVAVKKDKNTDNKETQKEEESKTKTETNAAGDSQTTVASGKDSTKKSTNSNKSTTTKKETSSNKPSGGGSSSSKTETTTKKEEPAAHTHSWKPVYKEVDNGRWGKELVKDAWTEEIPQYTMVYRSFCNGCGKDITENVWEHMESQVLAGHFECGGYTDKPIKTQIGTKTVEHPAEYKDVWIPKMEKVIDYYKCSCGARK